MTATHVMVEDVAVRIRAQLLEASNPPGQSAPAEGKLLQMHSAVTLGHALFVCAEAPRIVPAHRAGTKLESCVAAFKLG